VRRHGPGSGARAAQGRRACAYGTTAGRFERARACPRSPRDTGGMSRGAGAGWGPRSRRRAQMPRAVRCPGKTEVRRGGSRLSARGGRRRPLAGVIRVGGSSRSPPAHRMDAIRRSDAWPRTLEHGRTRGAWRAPRAGSPNGNHRRSASRRLGSGAERFERDQGHAAPGQPSHRSRSLLRRARTLKWAAARHGQRSSAWPRAWARRWAVRRRHGRAHGLGAHLIGRGCCIDSATKCRIGEVGARGAASAPVAPGPPGHRGRRPRRGQTGRRSRANPASSSRVTAVVRELARAPAAGGASWVARHAPAPGRPSGARDGGGPAIPLARTGSEEKDEGRGLHARRPSRSSASRSTPPHRVEHGRA
jgi:hypothetical protein